jgi:hypothetical protein
LFQVFVKIVLTLKKCNEINSLVKFQQKSFRQFDDPVSSFSASKFANLFNLKKISHTVNLPVAGLNFNQQPEFENPQFQTQALNYQPHPFYFQTNTGKNLGAQNYTAHHNRHFNQPYRPIQQTQTNTKKTLQHHGRITKPALWNEFKRIYITEVLTFTMSKSTLFTLIFSFMFLGCVFFLSGFFTATNIYREQHSLNNVRKHVPSETAMLQGRPEKVVNMGAGIDHTVPKSYQYQGGVKVNQNARRPSPYVEEQINSRQPYYR